MTADFDNSFVTIELLEIYKDSAEYYEIMYSEPGFPDAERTMSDVKELVDSIDFSVSK